MLKMKCCYPLLLILLFQVSYGQNDLKGWHLRDQAADGYNGISLKQTYDFLKGKNYTNIIVAVIDSGIDTTHEDLKKILWKNTKEIPGNGIDDDGNGYVDDVNGWNFLGNKNGDNLKKETSEKSRVYYRFKDKFSSKQIDTLLLTADEKWQYEEWSKAAAQIDVTADEQMQVQMLDIICKSLKKNDQVIRVEMNKDEYTPGELEKFEPGTQKGKQAKMGYITCLKMLSLEDEQTNKDLITDLEEYVEGKKQTIESKTIAPPDYRAAIIKDNYFDINDRFYGNNDIMGPEPMHGTHVSGIIAADRNNNTGVDGIADHVQIMMIRALPDGDEYDKDIALAIKYAVDNGAKVINMSFGKSFSPEKKWVDQAVHYAESKDVLLIHASGNESHNTDSVDIFPNPELLTLNEKADNFISVGASGDKKVASGKVIADFSNYGSNTVDVFAPGVKIYSSLPGGNQYGFLNGTSMAAPVVTGIAALIRSYYPLLSAKQVKYAIDKSAENIDDTDAVTVPGTNRVAAMNNLCTSGGFANAYKAIEFASTLKPEAIKTDKNIKPTLINTKESKKL